MVHSAVNSTIDSLPITLGAEWQNHWQHLEQLLHAGDASKTQFMHQVAHRIQAATDTYNGRYGPNEQIHLDNNNSYTVHYLGTTGQDHHPIVVVHIGGASNTGDLRLYMGMDLSGETSEEHLCYIAHIEDNVVHSSPDHGQIDLYNLNPSHSTTWTQVEFGSQSMNELDRIALCGLSRAPAEALAAQVARAADAARAQADAASSRADSAAAEAERLHDAVRTAQAAFQEQDAAMPDLQARAEGAERAADDAHTRWWNLCNQHFAAQTSLNQAYAAEQSIRDRLRTASNNAANNSDYLLGGADNPLSWLYDHTYFGNSTPYDRARQQMQEAQNELQLQLEQVQSAEHLEQAIKAQRDSADADCRNLRNEITARDQGQTNLAQAQSDATHAEHAWERARDRAQELATVAEAAEETARTLGGTHTQV